MHSFTFAKCCFCFLLLLVSMYGIGQSSQPISNEVVKINEVTAIPTIKLNTLTLSTDTLFKVKRNRRMNFVFQYYFDKDFVTLYGCTHAF